MQSEVILSANESYYTNYLNVVITKDGKNISVDYFVGSNNCFRSNITESFLKKQKDIIKTIEEISSSFNFLKDKYKNISVFETIEISEQVYLEIRFDKKANDYTSVEEPLLIFRSVVTGDKIVSVFSSKFLKLLENTSKAVEDIFNC